MRRNLYDNNTSTSDDVLVPTVQTSNIVLATRSQTAITVAMTAGNGNGRLVAVTKFNNGYLGNIPENGVFYSVGQSFGTNTEIIAIGDVTQATATELAPNQWATFRAFEYNTNGTNIKYNTNTASYNPRSLKTLA